MHLPPYVLSVKDDMTFKFAGREWRCQIQDKFNGGMDPRKSTLVLVCIDEKEWKVLVKEPVKVKILDSDSAD